MKTFRLLQLVLGIAYLSSCTSEPKPIQYGNDGCHYCKMTIVDKIHGAEIVTKKGKIYKFDAMECMLNFTDDFGEGEIKLQLTNHFETPEELINSENSYFLISKKLPSPMGANLTSFKSKDAAEKAQQEYGGQTYTWIELQNRWRKRIPNQ